MNRIGKKTKKSIKVFNKSISHDTLFALILCTIICISMIYTTIYRNKKLSKNTEVVCAEIIDIYQVNKGKMIWRYEMKYKFYINYKEYVWIHSVQNNELDKIHIGDCIEIIVSLDNTKVQKWNKSKGTFKCR